MYDEAITTHMCPWLNSHSKMWVHILRDTNKVYVVFSIKP